MAYHRGITSDNSKQYLNETKYCNRIIHLKNAKERLLNKGKYSIHIIFAKFCSSEKKNSVVSLTRSLAGNRTQTVRQGETNHYPLVRTPGPIAASIWPAFQHLLQGTKIELLMFVASVTY